MVSFYKVVSELPETIQKDAIYAVRTGVGFDLYIADATGNTAHGLNGSFITASATVATPRYIYFDLGERSIGMTAQILREQARLALGLTEKHWSI